jgi:nitrogen PTS system EIIA component
MRLNVRDAARMLTVSESQVYRWVEAGEIPCYLVNHQPQFSPAELLEWATARRLPASIELFEDGDEETTEASTVRLGEALALGGIHYDVPGTDRVSVLRALVERLPVADQEDRALLSEILMAREALGSTGIGQGIAIPHVRSPLIFPGMPPSVTLCFLERPIPFAAIDDQPVHTIFALLSATIRGHLQLLSRLSLALLDPVFKDLVIRRAPRAQILAEARRVDLTLAQQQAGRAGQSRR